jgi:NAD(P)-dependent dehydrogenase (short-subunit alcohol dehydrogenase family)
LIGFVRSIGDRLFKEGIRVNAICPGVVKTPLLNEELLSYFPADVLIPIEAVTDVAMKIILDDSIKDSKGVCVTADKFHSQAIHVTGKGFYLIDQPPINDEEAQTTWECMMGWR